MINSNSTTYLWIEDREGGAGYTFWKCFLEKLFPQVVLQSHNNSSELVKAVIKIEDDGNKYIILHDYSLDNPQCVAEHKKLVRETKGKSNIVVLKYTSFEYMLLEFDGLIEWIYAADDPFREKRANYIELRKAIIDGERTGIYNFNEVKNLLNNTNHNGNYNIEQLVARVLEELTKNTGFEVTKSSVGECWLLDCCDWQQRQDDDICGLDNNRLTVREKMLSISAGTSIGSQLSAIGMEVAS